VLVGHHGVAAGQAAATGAVDQLPRLHPVRVAESRTTGAGTHGLRRFPRGLDLRHAGSNQRRRSWRGAQVDPCDDGPGRQCRVAIREGQLRAEQPVLFAGAGYDVGPVQNGRQITAVSTGIHRHRATDRAGNPRQKLQPGQPGGGGMFGDGDIQSRRTGGDPAGIGLDHGEPARQTDRDARQTAIPHDQIRARPDHLHRDLVRQRRKKAGQIISIGRTHKHLGGAPRAEPRKRRQRRIDLHAATHFRQHVDKSGTVCRGHHGAGVRLMPPACFEPTACNAARSAGSVAAHCVIEPAPRHTTKSPERAMACTISAR